MCAGFRPCSAADAEQLVGQVNPVAFQKAQQADDEGLEVLREHVGLLKKVCRQKAVYCLKDVRRQVRTLHACCVRACVRMCVPLVHEVLSVPTSDL